MSDSSTVVCTHAARKRSWVVYNRRFLLACQQPVQHLIIKRNSSSDDSAKQMELNLVFINGKPVGPEEPKYILNVDLLRCIELDLEC